MRLAKLHSLFGEIMKALVDPKRRDAIVIFLLVLYVLVWTAYATIANLCQDIHFDMGELTALAREPALGYPKHPPMSIWIADLWFGLFPRSDWAFYLLAMSSAAVGLWFAWRLTENRLDYEKRVVGLALITFVPFFNFRAFQYNANTALIPFWAATTFWFLRSFETQKTGYAVLAGLAAAGGILGKYWSVMLIAGLGIAALADPRRRIYFRSSAPWVTIAVVSISIAPHIAWLLSHEFPNIRYLESKTHEASFEFNAISPLRYISGIIAYAIAPVVVLGLARLNGTSLKLFWPRILEHRLVLLAFLLPLLLPLLLTLAGLYVHSSWAISGMALLPIVLLLPIDLPPQRIVMNRVMMLALAFPIMMVLMSPAITYTNFRKEALDYRTDYRLLANAVGGSWRASSSQPLRYLGGEQNIVNGVYFYIPSSPSTLNVLHPWLTPWVTAELIAKYGIVLVCPLDDFVCVQAIERIPQNRDSERQELDIVPRLWGMTGGRTRYLIITIPPTQRSYSHPAVYGFGYIVPPALTR